MDNEQLTDERILEICAETDLKELVANRRFYHLLADGVILGDFQAAMVRNIRAVLAASPQPAPKTGEGAAIEGVPDLAEHYRKAIAQVCEGWTLPDGARKTLEAALWSPPPAAAAPSGSQEKRNG